MKKELIRLATQTAKRLWDEDMLFMISNMSANKLTTADIGTLKAYINNN